MTLPAAKTRKPKSCRSCGNDFHPAKSTEKVCSIKCAIEFGRRPENMKTARKAIADRERREIKVRKQRLKSRGDYLREAQQSFNAFIRERDRQAGYPCISSGRPLDWSGNQVDAGHYRSTGAAPHLRFDERNCHAQSKHDNRFLSGSAVDYRLGLIARIGLEAVESLEADQSVRKYTIDDLQQIKATYRAKLRALKKEDSQCA